VASGAAVDDEVVAVALEAEAQVEVAPEVEGQGVEVPEVEAQVVVGVDRVGKPPPKGLPVAQRRQALRLLMPVAKGVVVV